MLIGHDEASWQNLMTVDDWFEDLGFSNSDKTLVLNLGISGR